MSIACKMKEIADKAQPLMTFEETHKLLNDIEAAAKQGKYRVAVNCNSKSKDMISYLEKQGFKVISKAYNNEGIRSIYVDWEYIDE